jgi:hypothetical protein
MNSILLRKRNSKSLAIIIALVFALVVGLGGAAAAPSYAAAAIDYTSHSVTAYHENPAEDTQNIEVKFTYPGAVRVGPNAAASFRITVGGSAIDPSRLTVETDPSDADSLIVNIGPNPGFTAAYSGILELVATSDVPIYIGGTFVGGIELRTVVPLGIKLAGYGQEGQLNSASLTIGTKAQIRGMYHFGIYTKPDDSSTALTPIWDDTAGLGHGTIDVDAYTSHAHSFDTMTPTDLATDIADAINSSAAFADAYSHGYRVTSNGPTITVSTLYNERVYFYIWDDDLINAVNKAGGNVTYDSLIADDGVLPVEPDYSEPVL